MHLALVTLGEIPGETHLGIRLEKYLLLMRTNIKLVLKNYSFIVSLYKTIYLMVQTINLNYVFLF